MLFRYKFILVVAVLILLVISACLFFNPDTKDFGINLATELIGVIITVCIIDYLIKKSYRKKLGEVDFINKAILLKVCDRVINTYYPERENLGWKAVKYSFGKHPIITYMNPLKPYRQYKCSVEDKMLFTKHIETMYGKEVFIENELLFATLNEEYKKLLIQITKLEQVLPKASIIESNDVYFLGYRLYYHLSNYLELSDIQIPGWDHIAEFLSEYHMPMVNSAIALRQIILRNSKCKILLDMTNWDRNN